jgi:hypothetical protein
MALQKPHVLGLVVPHLVKQESHRREKKTQIFARWRISRG